MSDAVPNVPIDPAPSIRPADDGPNCRRFRSAVDPLVVFCLSIFAVGFVLRITVRDGIPILAVVYYALPTSVLALLALLSGGLLLRKRRHKSAIAMIAAGLLCLMWWVQTSYFRNQPPTSPDAVRVLFWNCQRGRAGRRAIAEEIRRIDAPLVGLVEAGELTEGRPHFWTREFPEYDVALPGGGIALLARGKIVNSTFVDLGGTGRCGRFDVLIDGQRLRVVVADVESSPLISRRRPLERLIAEVRRDDEQPVLLMGDLNTPSDSVYLDELRREFSNAFETGGTGLAETWPFPISVLTLDQVWVNRRLQVNGCRLGRSWSSDHRSIVTEMTILPK